MPGGGGGSRAKREARHNPEDHTHKGEGVATRRNRVQGKKLDEIMGHIKKGRGRR